MSQAPRTQDEGTTTPSPSLIALALAFVVPVAALGAALTLAYSLKSTGDAGQSEQAALQRIMPVGRVQLQAAPAVPAGARTGEEVYKAQCSTCHATGTLGAPKFSDAAAWAPRIGAGVEALLNSALKGKNNMTAQGGGAFTDTEIKRAVVYMANAGGAKFPEPAGGDAPAAPAADAAASAPAAASASAPAAPAASTAAAPAATAVATAPALAKAGAAPALYNTCAACHASGVMNAPKLGDKAAWAPRLALGVDGLTASAIKGKNLMPPKGGTGASDAEIKAVVAYMVSQAK
jgi:cytochrome c5